MLPTKEEMFDWLIENKITIEYHRPIRWVKEDGSEFYCNFTMNTTTSRFSPAPTVEEAIIESMKMYKNGKWVLT